MKVTIVGVKSVDYVSNKTGQPVQGATLFFNREPIDNEANFTAGMVADSIYVSAKSSLFGEVKKLKLNSCYNFRYDFDGRRSYLSDIEPIEL